MIRHSYIHIPFCIRKCKYCSFVSGYDISLKEKYLEALHREIIEKYKGEVQDTIYIGGGTPSLLEADDIDKILKYFKYDNNTEITLEANPETVTVDKFKALKKAGINRISLGVQTFNKDLLKLIGRNHTKQDILNAVNAVKNAGFSNISIDLIYGLPSQTLDDVINDTEEALKLNIQHLSTYGLKIEENSFFYDNMPDNIPDDEVQAQMYLKLCEISAKNGFNHYEISNFALTGYESKHNTAYWKNEEYYGFGLNASGFEKKIRYKNTSKMEEYLENPLLKEEEIQLSEQENTENEIFLALRLAKGINVKEFNKKQNVDFVKKYKNILDKYSDLISISEDSISLTERGFLLSNEIMSEFIVE